MKNGSGGDGSLIQSREKAMRMRRQTAFITGVEAGSIETGQAPKQYSKFTRHARHIEMCIKLSTLMF